MDSCIYEQAAASLDRNSITAIQTVFRGTEGTVGEDLVRRIVPAEYGRDRDGNPYVRVTCTESDARMTLTEPVVPEERLIILGGGHVSLQLCELAARCGFRIALCDDREEFANRERFAMAETVLCGPYEDCIAQLHVSAQDYVVIVTRGHAYDRACLKMILPGEEPAYTGMIGSRSRVQGLFAMLEGEGYPRERMNRICSPVGLKIGGVTPEEIAVSIMAEIIAYRRLPEHAAGRLRNHSDLDPEIIRYLAENRGNQAVVTVLDTRGSTPRKAGAKMVVRADGTIFGTVGGGSAEGSVIRQALALAGSGRYSICSFDMTGDPAAEEDNVCGGVMRVLIEDDVSGDAENRQA